MEEPGTCVLGIDFGSYKSKITLAYRTTRYRQPKVEIIRVPFQGGLDDPERPDTYSHPDSTYEFVAFAALENGRLVPGRRSLLKDHSLPLKTIFIHSAGVTRESTITRLPGGVDLLDHCSAGIITPEMETEVLKEHFELLRQMAEAQAEATQGGLRIIEVVLSYPNYLCPIEQEGDFIQYASYYKKLLRPIWGKGIPFRLVSEGQAAARKSPLYRLAPGKYDLVKLTT